MESISDWLYNRFSEVVRYRKIITSLLMAVLGNFQL